ncbi:MAG: aminodeoxychorismate synthase component I [Gammaproteobacteria bacterium]|nr:aminodeoxychorismate synthase component I [Gammaproteobacteria bacterium]
MRRLHREHPCRYPFLLQSTTRDGVIGRFDILFAFPGKTLELEFDGRLSGPHSEGNSSFLDALDAWWSAERTPVAAGGLPFLGGWFVYLGYELAATIEPGLRLEADRVLPGAFAVRCKTALVFDHREQACYLVCESRQCHDEKQLRRDISGLQIIEKTAKPALRSIREQRSRRFVDAVNAAKRHIAAGDIYQANLSRQWTAELRDDRDASDIYEALCASNPGPFAGIVRFRDVDLLCSSPERLLRIRDGNASTRPIAGTRPRSADGGADSSLSAELLAHPKEIAEHVMLVDLERNDLGRICEPGSVQVDEMMVLESYAHVHHIVSNITGRLRDDVTPGQAIAAVFPGGTITGAPKVRCMEIIGELEEAPRGAYTGSFGYLNRDGSMDLNILIRTMVKQGSSLSFRAGSGIVADSDAHAELEETRAKAKGMLRALI